MSCHISVVSCHLSSVSCPLSAVLSQLPSDSCQPYCAVQVLRGELNPGWGTILLSISSLCNADPSRALRLVIVWYSDSLTVWQSHSSVLPSYSLTGWQSDCLAVWQFDSVIILQYDSQTDWLSCSLTMWQIISINVWQSDCLAVSKCESVTV